MRNIFKIFAVCAILAISGLSYGATTSGTVTLSQSNVGSLYKYKYDWTSDASGNVVDNTLTIRGGYIQRVAVTSDDGATSPTNLYDFTIKDSDNFDVLQANGANWATATDDSFCPVLKVTDDSTSTVTKIPVMGTMTLAITNAGNARGGTITIYVDSYR